MNGADSRGTAFETPTHSRWVGLLYSLILSGAGQFLAGRRVRGIAWHVSIYLLCLAAYFLLPMKAHFSLHAAVVLLFLSLGVWVAMLGDSYRPIPRRHWSLLILVIALSWALGTVERLGLRQVCRAFKIPAENMQPTLQMRDRVFVSRYAYWFSEPRRGDIIVFQTRGVPELARAADEGKLFYVKRIIGLPGETLEITRSGSLIVNGKVMDIEWRKEGWSIETPNIPIKYATEGNPYRIAEGHYFVIGDNTAHSWDSRYWGTVPRQSIVGKVGNRFWPFSRMGIVQ